MSTISGHVHSGTSRKRRRCSPRRFIQQDPSVLMGMLCQRITVRTGVVFTLVVLIVAGPLLTGTVACAGQARTDVNTKDARGLTALERAVTQGDISSVLALIQAGADVNATDNSGKTVLYWAALQGRLEIVRALAQAGADVNVKDEQG
jgi:ankyrin repeat protein